ncbi:pirin family protein [Pseudohalocynthiibacter aestuariivivens]|jgi:redox-sensitive bicupin YhaK (pirin superfamily)|uniref:Pirin family protein n=1 Tax=Pseudohalocynthiibacter aestuariivivens TaxID=1591409 RepID=A0ABV5JGX9_9RHOB|nr:MULTISPECIES: pirin family protein [Pseudohalocynthiibacter]MBS9718209.1 pirin family protein [Pseudohalocynthiibacter aestuariivivens]MCK0103857.1 pirin family protein [Pseudohalocynthiibacter sp. F2068]
MTVQHTEPTYTSQAAIIRSQQGEKITRGDDFEAISFIHRQLDGLMDPLIMVDHFTMTAPTFGPHAHAGLSAVSVLFEDSTGSFRNKDSLGNDIELAPGDLYWLKAARGAVHDEAPTPGSRTHALQIFVNQPAAQKQDEPSARHVPADEMPVIKGPGHRVRVMTGKSNGVVGVIPPAMPFTILDIALQANGSFTHRPDPGDATWLHLIRGEIGVDLDGTRHRLSSDTALAAHGADEIRLLSSEGGQAVLLGGAPLREPFVQKGPFAMRDVHQLAAVIAAQEAGEFGTID